MRVIKHGLLAKATGPFFLDASFPNSYNVKIMRIGLVSDTHIPHHVPKLPVEILAEAFRGVDLIMHGGDIYTIPVLDELEKIAPVIAALGDDDYGPIVRDPRVKPRHVLKVGDLVIWLAHERPYIPRMSDEWWETRKNPEKSEYGKPHIVIFGHEHRTVDETADGIHFISSGSPTFLHYKLGLGTIGFLDTDSGHPTANIVQL